MNSKNNKIAQLNKGFTLIEVLVAVIILAIVSIPVFRAIATSFNTTGRSAMKMRATNAAENLMEDIKALNVEQVINKYGDGSIDYDPTDLNKEYTITLPSVSTSYDEDLKYVLDKGYLTTIKISPKYYTNTNSVNMSEFNSVSSDTAAIYSMSPTTDTQVYEDFEILNSKNRDDNDAYKDQMSIWTDIDFAENLKREIRVDINKAGEFTDEEGNKQDKVVVDLTVSYMLPHSFNDKLANDVYKLVPLQEETHVAVSRQLFNNTSSEEPFSGVFIMYYPRYENAKDNGDIIIVHNNDEVKTNLYIVAQNTNSSDYSGYVNKSQKPGLILQVYENTITDEVTGESIHPTKLFTNLIKVGGDDGVEYVKNKDNENVEADRQVPALCFLTVGKKTADPEGIDDKFTEDVYKRIVSKKNNKFADKEDSYELRTSTLDGKTGDGSSIENRIYDVFVTVDSNPADDTVWPVKVELSGTILK